MEQNELMKRGLYIKKCKLCGSMFTSSRLDASYCQNPNPKYNQKKCSKVGPRISLFNESQYAKFNSIRAALYKWCDENRRFARENADHTTYKAIDSELIKLQQDWRQNADNARVLFKDGKISEQEFYDRLKLPKPKDRSKTLTTLRDSLR